MLRPFNRETPVVLRIKLLLGLALLLLASFAGAQNNLGELLDGGANKISAEEFRENVVQRTLVGPTLAGARLELMYASSGVIQGRSTADVDGRNVAPTMPYASIDGAWNIDDKGRICTSMAIYRIILPFRCQYWFRLKDDYFIADSEDRSAKVLRRTVKQ